MDIRAEFEAAYYRIAVSYNTTSGQVPLPRLASGQYKSFDVEEAWRFYRAGAEDMRERAAKHFEGLPDIELYGDGAAEIVRALPVDNAGGTAPHSPV